MKNTKSDDEIIFYVKDIKGFQDGEKLTFVIERNFIAKREVRNTSMVMEIKLPMDISEIKVLTSNVLNCIFKNLWDHPWNTNRTVAVSVEDLISRSNVFDFNLDNITDYVFFLGQKDQFKYVYPKEKKQWFEVEENKIQEVLELLIKNTTSCIEFFREQFVPFRTKSEKNYVKDMFQGKLLKKRGAHGNFFYKTMANIFTEVYTEKHENYSFIKVFRVLKEGGIYKITY